jgi:GNAT superfamily N-acetyltransferase
MTGERAIAGPDGAVEVRAAESEDIPMLISLARTIWHAHYPAIITPAQIEYMLGQRYRTEVIEAELQRSDLWWEIATVQGEAAGFSSCLLTAAPGEMKLDKLYVLAERQGQGVGRALLESVRARARRLDCTRIILAVNKRNASAIAAYRSWGFAIEHAMVNDIGGGFVMDDYQMVLAP